MIPTKVLITGLDSEVTEERICSWLGHFGPVQRVEIIRDGSATEPVALVEIAIGDREAVHLVSRLTNYWHEGKLVNAHILHH